MVDDGPPGPGIDARGRDVVDPTKNVLDLVQAEARRQDDLRVAEAKLRDSQIQHSREVAQIRADYQREIRESEADRLDAIRAVDVQAVATSAAEQEARATALAARVESTAEALRAQVAATTQAARTESAALLDPIQKRIDDLTRAQYEAQGQKTQVVETRASSGNAVSFAALGLTFVFLVISLVSLAVTLTR
jgi:hypothetical protein